MFRSLFQEPLAANIKEILKVVCLFPKILEDEQNEELWEEVTKDELEIVL